MPTFYLALGTRPSWQDLNLALACGQRDFLVPAGSRAAQRLRSTPGVRVVLDSGAWPPDNPDRLSLPAYVRDVRSWCGHPRFAWACTYDTIGCAARTAADHQRLLSYPWPVGEVPIVPVTHYPNGSAGDIIGDLRDTLDNLDDEERHSYPLGLNLGAVDGPTDWPACAIGGLVPAHYSNDAAVWYEALITELEAADELCPLTRRIHLLGISRPSWVLRSSLVQSFDSSMPARQAAHGWPKIAPSYTDAFGLTPARLQRSRAARFVYWVCWIRAAVGLPWQRVEDSLIADDPAGPADQQCSAGHQLPLELVPTWT